MTLSSDGVFEDYLAANGAVWRRAEGHNVIADKNAYLWRMGLELGRIKLARELRPNQCLVRGKLLPS